jgi:hypothetical protein
MPNYEYIRELCQERSELSRAVIDDFLVYYAARRDKLSEEFDARISRFKHATKELQPNWTGLFKAQYIAHRIFKQAGLISKYLNHVAIKELHAEQQNYLRQMAAQPLNKRNPRLAWVWL